MKNPISHKNSAIRILLAGFLLSTVIQADEVSEMRTELNTIIKDSNLPLEASTKCTTNAKTLEEILGCMELIDKEKAEYLVKLEKETEDAQKQIELAERKQLEAEKAQLEAERLTKLNDETAKHQLADAVAKAEKARLEAADAEANALKTAEEASLHAEAVKQSKDVKMNTKVLSDREKDMADKREKFLAKRQERAEEAKLKIEERKEQQKMLHSQNKEEGK